HLSVSCLYVAPRSPRSFPTRRSSDLGFAVGQLAALHLLEQLKVLLDAAIAVGAVSAGLGQGAPVLADLLGAEAVHVSLAVLDELDRKSTRLNSSHVKTSYAVFCLKKK